MALLGLVPSLLLQMAKAPKAGEEPRALPWVGTVSTHLPEILD